MLGIWELQPHTEASRFCAEHFEETSEKLDPEHLKLYRSTECPYDHYDFMRLEISPHITVRGSSTHTISSRCISYALWTHDASKTKHRIIPLLRSMDSLQNINGTLGFRLNEDNLLKYLTCLGHVISNPPFYFFYRISQLNALMPDDTSSHQEKAINAVRAAFPVQPDGTLSISVRKTAYPLLGSAIVVDVPCLYDGALYITTMKLSEDGSPEMKGQRPLQVEGVFDDEPNYNYYPLDHSPQLSSDLAVFSRRANRIHTWTIRTLVVDSFLQFWVLPLFAFHLFVIFSLGLNSPEVSEYFDRLKDSSFLYLISAFIGGLGLAIAVFRYVFLEITNYLRKLIPSKWSSIASEVESTSKQQLANLGYPAYFIMMTVEHSLKILMALSLTIYAAAWVGVFDDRTFNFGQAVMTILANLPLVGGLIEKALATTALPPVAFTGLAGTVINTLTGFLFSTVLLGLMTRLFLLTRNQSD